MPPYREEFKMCMTDKQYKKALKEKGQQMKPKKVTEIAIAKYFSTTTQTLRNWRNSEEVGENERYSALRTHFIKKKEKQDENSNSIS